MEIKTQEIATPESEKECIHLTKNSKGYNWELKTFPVGVKDLDDNFKDTGKRNYVINDLDIDRLVELNNRMLKEFGNNVE